MEAKQFYSRSISPLVIKSFACKWSEDNRLSVVTEKGVQIIELVPSAKQANPILNLARSFINPPETLPCELFERNVLSNIFNWSKEEVYSYLLQDALTPTFPKALPATPDIVDVFWSPRRLLDPLQCLIAVVTTTGAIELVAQIDRSWISIYEFSSVLAQIVGKDIKALDNKESSEELKEQLYRMLVTTATWSSLMQTSDKNYFAYLVTGHRSSEIVIWKVNEISSENICLDVRVKDVELKFRKKLCTESTKINTLLWVDFTENNYFLFIGFFNGQVAVLQLQESEESIISPLYEICYSEDDGIPVDCLYILQQTNEWFEILVVKGMYLIILTIDIHGKLISMKSLSSPGFSITGVSIIDPNKILIAIQDGYLFMVKKNQDQEELICTPIKLDISKNFVQYLGLANSANKILLTFVTSPNMVYDHLITREPSTIHFFNIANFSSLDPLDILYKNNKESLMNYWDCLEMVKINALKNSNLPEILLQVTADLESLPVYKLRIAYWIMIMSETLRKKHVFENTSKVPEEIEQCKSYIFLHSAGNHLNSLAQRDNPSDVQKLCMSLLRNHLEIWLAGEEEEADTPLSEFVKKVLTATSNLNLTEREKCNFCDVVITEPWALNCSTGHKLPRCALTCLQVTCTKYRTCVVCKEIFHPCLDEEYDEVKCLYCDLPVTYKSRLSDNFLQTSKKNLSRKRVTASNIKDSKEEDM